MNIGERIKDARIKKDLTLLEVAERLGKTEATIQRYESGNIKNLKNDIILELAQILNVSPAYLMGWEKPANAYEVKPNFVKIPILGEIACGGAALVYESVEGYTTEPISDLPSGSVFALRAKGESMLPTIPDGALVIIREQAVVENGEVAAVLLNGDTEATIKRIKRQGDVLLLVPDNKDYDIIIVDDNNPARIIGKAISVKYKL